MVTQILAEHPANTAGGAAVFGGRGFVLGGYAPGQAKGRVRVQDEGHLGFRASLRVILELYWDNGKQIETAIMGCIGFRV